jgi:hypothetical protein
VDAVRLSHLLAKYSLKVPHSEEELLTAAIDLAEVARMPAPTSQSSPTVALTSTAKPVRCFGLAGSIIALFVG